RAGLVYSSTDGDAFNVFERDEVMRSILADAVNPRNVFVVELGSRSSFLIEPLDDLRITGLVRRQQLESDMAIELHVQRFENGTRSTDADRFFEHERANDLAGAG